MSWPLQVVLEETAAGRCELSGDPHIKTIDHFWYDLYDVGQFLAWKTERRNFEVRLIGRYLAGF